MSMDQIIFTYILLASSTPRCLSARRRTGLRVLYGVPDKANKYSYVVALVTTSERKCTGTLLAPEWVLTAAHCIEAENEVTHVQYGNMEHFPYQNESRKSEILQEVPHPGYQRNSGKDDVALLRVSPISLEVFGTLSAIDYKSLMGVAVEYAGFGTTEFENEEDDRRPLMIGEGVVRSCSIITDENYVIGAFMCVAPKCTNNNGDSASGDSGGPLFYDKKIIGIVSSGETPIGVYTAVSPYIIWIRENMRLYENRRQSSHKAKNIKLRTLFSLDEIS